MDEKELLREFQLWIIDKNGPLTEAAWLESARRQFERCAELEAENLRLRAELKGPNGFETWKDAAVYERLLRVNADRMAREECAGICDKMAEQRYNVTPDGCANAIRATIKEE